MKFTDLNSRIKYYTYITCLRIVSSLYAFWFRGGLSTDASQQRCGRFLYPCGPWITLIIQQNNMYAAARVNISKINWDSGHVNPFRLIIINWPASRLLLFSFRPCRGSTATRWLRKTLNGEIVSGSTCKNCFFFSFRVCVLLTQWILTNLTHFFSLLSPVYSSGVSAQKKFCKGPG